MKKRFTLRGCFLGLGIIFLLKLLIVGIAALGTPSYQNYTPNELTVYNTYPSNTPRIPYLITSTPYLNYYPQATLIPINNTCYQLGATALCNDNSCSFAANHQGACSHHRGVSEFYK